MLFFSSSETISAEKPDPNIFLWIAASVADPTALNSNGIKTFLASGWSIFPIKGNPVFNSVPKTLPKNPRDCAILCNWVFDKFYISQRITCKSFTKPWNLRIS